MAQAVARKSEVTTDASARSQKSQPRQKGGRFGTSEAALRRKAAGKDIEAKISALTPGFAAGIAIEEPTVPPAQRQEMAKASATIAAIGPGLAAGLIEKVRQSLSKNEGLRVLVEAVPEAARYIVRLVRGEEEGAPHAIRLQAALAVFDISGARLDPMKDDRDLSELSLDELRTRSASFESELDQRLTVATHSQDAPNEPNAAPLPPSNAKPELE